MPTGCFLTFLPEAGLRASLQCPGSLDPSSDQTPAQRGCTNQCIPLPLTVTRDVKPCLLAGCMATESIFIPPHRHLWVDCLGSSAAPAPCPGHTDLFVPRLLQRRRGCCPEDWPRPSCCPPPADPDHEGSILLLRVPTPEGSRQQGHHPSWHPEGWSDHV